MLCALALVLLAPAAIAAAAPGAPAAGDIGSAAYRSAFGASSRIVVWVVAELHLMFGAFVLGVPIFASIMEMVGWRTGQQRYDDLARDFTGLLSATFSTTAALGGALTLALFGLYPRLMAVLTGIFHETFYLYALLFFGEGVTLYLYHYGWERMRGRWKGWHLALGLLLNLWGTLLLLLANAWAAYMMSPSGIDPDTRRFVGTTWQAVANPLWLPLAIHRVLGNVAFGGFVVAAYAAVRFLGARSDAARAHYDWMGYAGNAVGLAALIPLPFAGYYLGREVYSASAVMGNSMMGGTFSWTFIIQAALIGILFVASNYYLWSGMERIEGAARYRPYIKYLNAALVLSFAVWLTPRNIPLTGEEQIALGGQFHPLLRYLGLMSAKNAAVNLIILSTLLSLLLYRRGNKGRTRPIAEQGRGALLAFGAVAVALIGALLWHGTSLLRLDPASLDLSSAQAGYFRPPAYLLFGQAGMVLLTAVLTLRDRGRGAQLVFLASTAAASVVGLGVYGFVVMERANPFLRNVAVAQWLMVLVCLVWATAIDGLVYHGAEVTGAIRWGRMTARSQYALVLLCVTIVMLMGLMGFVRSGLREDWHIYGVLADTSPWAWTPTNAYMMKVVGGITLVFLGLLSLIFWLAGPGEREHGSST